MRPNNICCIGGNHAGGLASCVIALKCPEVRVVVVDNEKTISEWNSNNPPFNEPDLEQVLKKCRHRNLFFSSNYATSIRDADMIFLPINVPIKSKPPGKKKVLDFRDLEEAGKLIAAHSESDKIVVEKSTVCARAVDRISTILESYSKPGVQYHVLSNPTSLTEGSAINDLLNPPCILIGCRKNPNNKAAAQSLCELYEHWVPRSKIKILHNWSAEVSSLAGNIFLAQKASSINALATICEESGADITAITDFLNKDSRLQTEHVKPSLGFGRFQKDLSSFILMCEMLQLTEVASYWQAVLEMNSLQMKRFLEKLKTILDPIDGKDITILGFAQSKNTSETKYSPAVEVCEWLLQRNCNLKIYDPQVPAAQIFKDLEIEFLPDRKEKVQVSNDVCSACCNTSALILCTDWDEFKNMDFSKIVKLLDKPVVIDGHRIWNERLLKLMGLEYYTTCSTSQMSPTPKVSATVSQAKTN